MGHRGFPNNNKARKSIQYQAGLEIRSGLFKHSLIVSSAPAIQPKSLCQTIKVPLYSKDKQKTKNASTCLKGPAPFGPPLQPLHPYAPWFFYILSAPSIELYRKSPVLFINSAITSSLPLQSALTGTLFLSCASFRFQFKCHFSDFPNSNTCHSCNLHVYDS